MSNKWCELLLLKKIDEMKMELLKEANSTGINSRETITCSQELDVLINLYMKFFTKNKKSKSSSLHEI